jgi:hypothetical protein
MAHAIHNWIKKFDENPSEACGQLSTQTLEAIIIAQITEGLFGPKSCFPAGTPVHTSVGMTPIEQVKVGDSVWSYDHRQLRWTERPVTEVYQLLHQGDMAILQVKGETIRATGGHPFWVVRGEALAERPLPIRIPAYEPAGRQKGRWVLARNLRTGDNVLLRQGEVVALESVQIGEVAESVYNFHVAELQNYAVGECGVLVHNTNDPSPGGVGRPYTPQQQALLQMIDDMTLGGRRPLTVAEANTVLDLAEECQLPGVRAGAGDVNPPGGPGLWDNQPHIHIPGAGRGGHVPVQPGVAPR